jgi:hypothetical protein
MRDTRRRLNGSCLSLIALDTTLSLSKVPSDVLPLGGSAIKLSSSQNASILYEKQTASVLNSKIPAVFSSCKGIVGQMTIKHGFLGNLAEGQE